MDRAGTAESLLLGRDPRRSVRLVTVAGVLFALTFLLHLPPRYVGPLAVPFGFALPALAAVSFLPAAIAAYRNDGLFVCVALAGGPTLGFYLALTVFDLAYPSETVLWGLAAGTGTALAFGTAGFVVGAVLWRLRTAVASAA